MARAMITQYGMSDKFGLMGLATQEDQYLTGRMVMNCGDATAAEVDNEVMKMLKEAYEEAKALLSDNRDVMDKIAEFLIEKETITGKEFMKIFREMKGIPEPEEKDKTDADKMDDVVSHKDTFDDKKEEAVLSSPAAEETAPKEPSQATTDTEEKSGSDEMFHMGVKR